MLPESDPQFQGAIDAGDFAAAKEIKSNYDSRELEQQEKALEDYKGELRDLVTTVRERMQMEIFTIKEQVASERTALRRQISDTFHELQVQHVATLVEFEKEHLLKIAREKIRAIGASNELREQAKAAAFGKDFVHAQELLDQANLIRDQELRNREEAVVKSFFEGRTKRIETQRSDLELLSKRLKDSLEDIDHAEVIRIQDLVKRYRKKLYLEYRAFTKSIRSEVTDAPLRQDCLKQCAQLYSSLAAEFEPE
jgi:hypothetical protein